MYVYESIKDEIWRRPEDIVFYEITSQFPDAWDNSIVYDLLVEALNLDGHVKDQMKENLENA